MNPQDNRNTRLFGFSYKEQDVDEVAKLSPIPPNMDDGVTVAAGGLQGYGVDLDGGGAKDVELIRKYRCMALHPEVDSAIEDIVNEAIVSDTNDTPVAIDLSNLDISERIKTIIREEFSYILHLLDFNNKSHEMFRRWFIDGRLYYHKGIDLNNPVGREQEAVAFYYKNLIEYALDQIALRFKQIEGQFALPRPIPAARITSLNRPKPPETKR